MTRSQRQGAVQTSCFQPQPLQGGGVGQPSRRIEELHRFGLATCGALQSV